MSTMESSYGVVGGGGIVQSNEDSEPQSFHAYGGSVGLMPNMGLAFSPDGAAVYKPLMPPTSPPHSASATPASAFPAFSEGPTVAAAPPSVTAAAGERTKRKRGRPRKYGPDGTMDPLMVSPLQLQSETATAAALSVSSPPSGKKPRGRPPGSRRKQKVAALGSRGVGFTPHIITVKAGEDVSSKIMSFSQNGRGAICILSANGAISNVTLRQASTSGGTVTYEGRFEILTLSGSYMLVESGGQRSRTGGLSVLLAGPDGRVLGGGVAGLLTAASPVQVVLGCFIAGQEDLKSPNQSDPSAAAPAKQVPGASAAGSPGSRGAPSESSGGPGSPLNHSTGNNINPQDMMTTLSWK